MTIAEITVLRAEQVERLMTRLDQAATAFKELEASTSALRNEVYRVGHTPGSNQPYVSPLQGMENLKERVQHIVEHKFFGPHQDKDIDLVSIVAHENAKALGVSNHG